MGRSSSVHFARHSKRFEVMALSTLSQDSPKGTIGMSGFGLSPLVVPYLYSVAALKSGMQSVIQCSAGRIAPGAGWQWLHHPLNRNTTENCQQPSRLQSKMVKSV